MQKMRAFTGRRQRFTAMDMVNYLVMAILTVITFYPIWYCIVVAFSTQAGYNADPYHIIPYTFSLETINYVLHNKAIFQAFFTSVGITVAGTCLSVILCAMAAYPLSKRHLRGQKLLFRLLIIPMFFSGGIVPWYITISKIFHLRDSYLVMILPSAISTYNVILMKNYFLSLPESLEESAKLDGYNDLQILFKIIIPISKPIFATITLFYAVTYWNDFFNAIMFISSDDKLPLSVILRNMIVANFNFMASGLQRQTPAQIKAAVIILSILPLMLVYPFVQKHFVQGIMLGSVKG